MTKPLSPNIAPPIDPSGQIDGEGPEFTPFPGRWRHDGWTAERQRIFISALAEYGCVSDACQVAGVSPRSAYRLRAREGAEGFDRAWRAALVMASSRLTALAFERAVYGAPRKIWHKGEVVAEERVPSDRLLMYLLKNFDRTRYGNLSGFLPCEVADPIDETRGGLPTLLAALADHPADRGVEDGEEC